MPETTDAIDAFMAEYRITMAAEFVPLSKSRNAASGRRSLNWKVAIATAGRAILVTDYMAGEGHTPAYKAAGWGRMSVATDEAIARECETGREARLNGMPILPDIYDVLASLASDAQVIDAGGFKSWAADMGFNTRKGGEGETMYRACLDIALALRSGLGNDGLVALQTATQDY